MRIDEIDGIDLSTFTDVMEAQYEDSISLVDKMLQVLGPDIRSPHVGSE